MKRKVKRWIFAIVIIVVAVTVSAVIGHLSGGFQNKPSDWDLQTVNEENLYQSMVFEKNLPSGADGVTAELLEDNVLKVRGTAEKVHDVKIATTTLKANTSYVFDSSLSSGSKGTMYMAIVAGENVLAACYGDAVVISASTLTEDTVVELHLYIANEFDVGSVTLHPVLCEGDSADDLVKFYE